MIYKYGLPLLVLVAALVVCEARGLLPLETNTRGFVRTEGTHFVLNGSPFYFNGFNSYWMMHVAADPSGIERNNVSQVLHDAAAAGFSVCRTWAFSDGGDRALHISPGVYDEHVFQAKKYGIRLILSFVNNYKDFGGRRQYVQWVQNAGSEDDFYAHPILKQYYKNHVKRVMTRLNTITRIAYKDDETIMAWELMSEPRCQSDYSGRTINGWVEEMAAYVKSIDNQHLLEIGMEGFYGDSMSERKQVNPGHQVGTDFISCNLVKDIDFTTIHAYPDIWLSGQNENSQTEVMQKSVENHWADSGKIVRKPLVITEFGKSSKDPGFSLSSRDSFMNTVFTDIDNLARNGVTIGGSLVWQLMAQGMNPYFDGYQIILSEDPSTDGVTSRQSHQMTDLSHF